MAAYQMLHCGPFNSVSSLVYQTALTIYSTAAIFLVSVAIQLFFNYWKTALALVMQAAIACEMLTNADTVSVEKQIVLSLLPAAKCTCYIEMSV